MPSHEIPERLSRFEPYIHTNSLPVDLPAPIFISLLKQLHEKTGRRWKENACSEATSITIWLNALLKTNDLNFEARTWVSGLGHQWTRIDVSDVIIDPFGVPEFSRGIVPFFGNLVNLEIMKFPNANRVYAAGKPLPPVREALFTIFS